MTFFASLCSLIAVIALFFSVFFLFHNSKKNQTKKKSKTIIISLLLLSICSFFLAITLDFTNDLLTEPLTTTIDYSKVGPYGDLIGGILNPLIAFIGIIAASLAFYAQYQANHQVQEQFKIQQFESQFYEMLRLHKDNVNEVSISEKKVLTYSLRNSQTALVDINGRKAFEYHVKEIELYYNAAKTIFDKKNSEYWLKKAYHLYFFGINNGGTNNFYRLPNRRPPKKPTEEQQFYNEIAKANIKFNTEKIEGHATYLAHLYRHLFQIVKFVASQQESFISYEEKRKYLRILRAQLSNPEQVMLFYNWKSGFGFKWEQSEKDKKDNSKQNRFFTDYRMIHNVYQDILIQDFKLIEIFDLKGDFRKEKEKDHDPLFEFEDWDND
ncbi:putative phage abortive infection protein [Flavobacterium sp. FlaQc-50]|uniref:putative phage abortive infection protein n=1 Tax=unclassified Flavobacterium TaxID=196869 RepID=UPI00375841A6